MSSAMVVSYDMRRFKFVEIMCLMMFFFSQRIVFIDNKVDSGVKKLVDIDPRDMFRLFYESKEEI